MRTLNEKKGKAKYLLNFYVCPITIDIMQFYTTLCTVRERANERNEISTMGKTTEQPMNECNNA